MLIDSHTHIYLPEFDEDFDEMILRARKENVQAFLLPNIDALSIQGLHQVCDRLPDHAFPMMGLHPCSVKEQYLDELEEIKRHLFQPVRKYWAVGEIGIDLYWDKSTLKAQTEALTRQIEWAKTLDLPVVLHIRDAFDETFEVIDRLNDEKLRGVFHCFTGTRQQAEHIIGYGGFKLGIGGVVTFKNGKIDRFIHEIDLSHIILETDAPYLAPVPHRGKRNEPAYLALVAQKLAECYGVSLEEVQNATTQNCIDLFQLNLPSDENNDISNSMHLDD
ncbi:MAG: TatD family hydrolase [Salibacteraceae bacterium]